MLHIFDNRSLGINLTVNTTPRVRADRLVLREAVTSIVDNAIKYSPADATITIAVDTVGEQAQLAVADQGPGIAADHRDRVFDGFYRIDEGRSRGMGGAGLGLAIAKWAVDANRGQLTLSSAEVGSVFTIAMPLITFR